MAAGKRRRPPAQDTRAADNASAAPPPANSQRIETDRSQPGWSPPNPLDETAILGTRRTRAATVSAYAARLIEWQILASGTLCAAGATLGLITLLHEAQYHLAAPPHGLARSTMALCAGVMLGLWVPRGMIRRRLRSGDGEARSAKVQFTGSDDLNLEFAASLSGVLIVAFALLWVALGAGAVLMEDCRAFLATRLLQPAPLKHSLLAGPAYLALVLAGASGTTLLAALHGWYRLAARPRANITRLWTWLLLGVLAAGLLAYPLGTAAFKARLAALIVFVAGALAVVRRTYGEAAGAAQPPKPVAAGNDRRDLLVAALAAATTGAALFLALPHLSMTFRSLGNGALALAVSSCAGLYAGRALSRSRLGADLGLWALLLAAATLLLPYPRIPAGSATLALAKLAVVNTFAATCVVLVARRVNHSSGSVQHALSWVGGSVAMGVGLASLLLSACVLRWGTASHMDRQAAQIVESNPLRQIACRLVLADPFSVARVAAPLSAGGGAPCDFDLGEPRVDVVVIEPTRGEDDCADAELGRRLLRRAASRLAAGGRLLVELPTAPSLAAALEQLDPRTVDSNWAGYRLRAQDEAHECEALLFGRDIPALVARNMPLPGVEVSLQPWHAVREQKR